MIVKRIPKVFKLRKARFTVFNFMEGLFNQSRSLFYIILILFVSLSFFFYLVLFREAPSGSANFENETYHY